MTAPLHQLGRTVTLPRDLPIFSDHDCFGYRVLLESFDTTEPLQSVIDLCGSPDLNCPTNRSPPRSPSPIHISPRTKPMLFIPSPSPPSRARVITSADYLDDEEFEEFFSKLTKEPVEGIPASVEPGPSNITKEVVVCFCQSPSNSPKPSIANLQSQGNDNVRDHQRMPQI